MEVPQFNQAIKNLEHMDAAQLSQLVNDIKFSLQVYQADYGKLGHALYRLCEQIMKIKDVKNQCVQLYQDLICTAIKISIENDLRVGFDAMRFVFNISADFYKTANPDMSLVYPIGKDHPLQQYNPEVGQDCDVVRPYITSTSFCGWTRCTVLEIDNNKYTIKYANSNNPNIIREKPWFAPLGSRTFDYDWRMSLEVGSPIQALLNRVWYKSTVAEIGEENGTKKVRVTYRRFAQDGDREDSQGNRYFGLGIGEDEWMDVLSSRIQKCGKMADTKLCYYTFNSQEILLDDSYDIIFEQQFKQNPFFAIMRIISCKSLSLIRFIDTFVRAKGIEKTLEVMNNLEINDDIAYSMMANIGAMVPFFPRMFIKNNPIFSQFYQNIVMYFIQTAKALNPYKIDMGYFCYDMMGRRLFSLSEVHAHQNQLRKVLIKQFLKMNMEKQMLALRYLNDLINPKKQYSENERESFNRFLKEQKIFDQIFNPNTHEQIISRTVIFLEYLIQRQIITLKEFEVIWKIVPASDTRGRAMIEKLLAQISKSIPLSYVEFLVSKILSLKETELTPENLNLLKELKNRNLGNQMQMKILSFLWDILTVKSGNVKQSIEQEVEKVFKGFVSTIKNPNVRMNLLDSMCQKLQDCKRVKNEIELLKDFIRSYPGSYDKSSLAEQCAGNVPLSIFEAVSFLKKRGIYEGLLNLLSKTKDELVIKDILQFIGFLFEHDFDEINSTLQRIYEKLGPSINFLSWIHHLLDRSLDFAIDLLEKTQDFSAFERIQQKGFEAIQSIIIDVNKTKNKINTIKTYEFKNNDSNVAGTQTESETKKEEKKESSKFIGPLLPQVKNHFYVLVSPFQLCGMKFLQNLLLVIKQSKVHQSIIKLIVQFISNLDESIEAKTEDFRREFLEDILKEIKSILQENKLNDKIKAKLTVYINLFEEIFGETQKNGLGDVRAHFQNIEGEVLSLNIDNLIDKQKNKNYKSPLPKFCVVMNENLTLWRLKERIGEIVNQKPENIDIIKYSDPMPDNFNGKSLSEMLFYSNQGIKIGKKQAKVIPRGSLLNNDKTDVSDKFQRIIRLLFQQYKNKELNGLSMSEMEVLSNQRWRGSLFRQREKLVSMFEDHDRDKKGYLSYNDFKEFFYVKSIKNEAAIWRIINLSGFKNNFTSSSGQVQLEMGKVNTLALPRKILSCPDVYDLIFAILGNETFKDIHLSFYRLLSMLQVDKRISTQIYKDIYEILGEKLNYKFCYTIEVASSLLTENSQLYYEFWQNRGLEIIQGRISEIFSEGKSPYQLEPIVKFGILPNLIKIQHMYVRELLSNLKLVKFISAKKINHLDPHDFVNKVNELKINEGKPDISEAGQKLKSSNFEQYFIRSIYRSTISVLHALMKNYVSEKSQYLQKITVETVRLLGCIISSNQKNHSLDPLELLYGIKNGSLNYRRASIILIYIYLFYSETPNPKESEKIIVELLGQLPKENKYEYEEYFIVLKQMICRYLEVYSDSNEKDAYFIDLGNKILDTIFNQIEGELRTSYSSDKTIVGILAIVEALIKKDSICKSLSSRKGEITQKCLFAYDIEQKLQNLQVTPEMLTNQKQAMHFKNYVICKTESSREITYRIVARLHELSQDDQDYLTKYILPLVMKIQPEARLTSSRSLAVGLKNFGSTCYMNSMLQVLNTVGPFRNSLMKLNSELNLIKELKKLFAALYFSERVDYAPGDLLAAFVPPINPGIQQDTTEFLNFLFDQLEAGLSSTRYKRLLDELFKGANTVQMICHSCGYKKQNREQFFSFGVEIEGKADLNSALQGSFQGETISDYLCDACHNRGQTTKRNILSEIPSVMFIHLRRIVFNYDMFVNMKIHTRLQFPQELNIQPYTKEGVELRESFGLEYMKKLSHNEEERKKFEKLAEHGKQKDFYKLKLKGVIVHSGSADVGHYYSILQNDGIWRKYDDSLIGIFAASDFQNYCYGGTFVADQWGSGTSANAYVLVYEKVVKNPIQILPQEPGKDLELLKYDDFKIHNNAEDYRQFWLDNHNFMVESQLLDSKVGKLFINFLCKVLSNSAKCPNKIQIISEVLYRISYHSGCVGDLLKILIENVNDVTPDILYNFVLKDKTRTLKLLFNYQRPIREFMSTYLQIALIQSFKKGDEKVKLDVLVYISELLNALPGQVAKNWMRIDGYFKLIYLLVISSTNFMQIWMLFMSRKLISTLIDYVMEKQSPVKINPKNYSVGTKSNPLDFFFAIATISFLLKHSYGLTGKNYESSPIPSQFLFHLNDNDVKCLSHMEFYRKMLRERQNLFDLAAIIHRLCIENLQFSKAICEVVLQAINSTTDSKDEMIDYSNICLQILKIKDNFWVNRAEMLLGVGLPSVINQNLMGSLDEQRFFFTSTIYDIFPIECLLSYSYLYRLKNTLACFQIIRAVVQGCSISKQAMKYLARQPSPTYLFPNLITWMENFILSFWSLVEVEKKQRERIEGEISNLLKYIEDLKIYMVASPQDRFHKSLITGEIVSKKEMHSFEKEGIEVKLYEYEVYCFNSTPTETGGNGSLDPHLESYRLTKAVTDNSNILKFFKKPGKSIALKLAPIEEDEDKELVGLFDQYSFPSLPGSDPVPQRKDQKPNQQEQMKMEQEKENKEEEKKEKGKGKEEKEKEEEKEVNLEGVFINNYFRQIQVINMSKDKKVVSVSFSSDDNCNFIVPKSFTWKLASKHNQSLWMARQDHQKGWENLQMKCHIEQYIKEKHEKKSITAWWFKTYGGGEEVPQPLPDKEATQKNEQAPDTEEKKAEEVENRATEVGPGQVDQYKACIVCTFNNPISNQACELCETPF